MQKQLSTPKFCLSKHSRSIEHNWPLSIPLQWTQIAGIKFLFFFSRFVYKIINCIGECCYYYFTTYFTYINMFIFSIADHFVVNQCITKMVFYNLIIKKYFILHWGKIFWVIYSDIHHEVFSWFGILGSNKTVRVGEIRRVMK